MSSESYGPSHFWAKTKTRIRAILPLYWGSRMNSRALWSGHASACAHQRGRSATRSFASTSEFVAQSCARQPTHNCVTNEAFTPADTDCHTPWENPDSTPRQSDPTFTTSSRVIQTTRPSVGEQANGTCGVMNRPPGNVTEPAREWSA
jgi:hypothetical protein